MARLDKLEIQGIRSFGPETGDKQRIGFHSPLTLILGQNGCGKTTIIECLKYALSGDLPPGAKQGRLFVHDPKISRKLETHGRIQLRFTDLKGDTLVVTRLMQLTQKAKNLEFKTKDSSLHRIDSNGQHADVSGRCIDIDAEVCAALGVSKSILNSVIFCHQEDAAWPLDEGKKVKERFDDIFDATKHNKYLELIRNKRKQIAEDVKLLINDIGHLRDIKDEVRSKKEELDKANNRMIVNRDQIDKYDKKLQPIEERLQKRKTELEGVKAGMLELEKNIQSKFRGSTRELEEFIERFHTDMKVKEVCRNNLTSKLSHLEKEDKKLQMDITKGEVEKGKLQKEMEHQQEKIDSRNKLLRRLAEHLEIHDTMSMSHTQVSEGEVATLLAQVNKKVKASEVALERLRVQLEKEEQEMQNKVDGYRDEKVSLEQQLSMKEKQMQTTKEEIRKIKGEIEEVDLSANKLVRVEAKLKRAVQDLEQVEKSLNVDQLKEEMKQAIDKRNRLEDQLEVIDKEVKLLQQQSTVQAELDIQRENKSMKESEIRKLKNKNEDTLKHLLRTVPEQGIKYELKLCIDGLAEEIRELSCGLNIKQRELTTLETNRKHQKEALRRREEDVRVKEELLYNACGNQDYDEVLKRCEEGVQELQDEKGTLSSSEYMFRHYIQKLQQPEPCCPLCHRGFDVDADVKELVNELNSKVREVPTHLRENSKKLESEKKKYEKLLELKPSHESVITFRTVEIPGLKAELEETEKKLGDLRIDVENLESRLIEPQADKKLAETVQPDVVLLDQHHTELQKLQREIDRLEAKLPAGRSSRSMQEALNEQERVKSEVQNIRHAIDDGQQKLTRHTDRLQELRDEKNRLTDERFKIEGGVRQRKQLEERQSKLQEIEAVLNEEACSLQEKLGESRMNFDTASKEKNAARLNNKEILNKEQNQLAGLQKQVDEIYRLQTSIRDFEQRGIDRKLVTVQQSLQDLETIKDTNLKSIQDMNTQIGDMNSELAKQQMKKRDLDDNLKLRSKEAEAEVLKKKIEELQKRLGDLKFETLLAEKKQLQREEETLTREKAQAEGRLKEQQVAISSLRGDLEKPIYANAERQYLEKVVKKKVMDAAANDLNSYYKATEWAMLHFHKEKMREINTIIRELWRQIYRGTDIDYIEIKTDVPEQSSADRRSQYNYRVVQMKNDVEIDMRGRCSAGQKVLASLIIRMALAETFSANCGILALDEPTTNLDCENIESLSTALADIVNTRMVQKNFQLLVITHDEEFLDRLSKVEKLEFFYRVTRDRDER
ncbi:hypothetical protein Cfor_05842, partial [Coptotermes formosanus]